MPLTLTQLTTLKANQSIIDQAEKALQTADITQLPGAQSTLDAAIAAQDAGLAALVADAPAAAPTFTARVTGTNAVTVSWTGGAPTTLARSGTDTNGTGPWTTGTLTGEPTTGSYTFYNMVPGNSYFFTMTLAGSLPLVTPVLLMPAAVTPPPPPPPPVVTPGTPKVVMGSFSNHDLPTHIAFMQQQGITDTDLTIYEDFVNTDSWPAAANTFGGNWATTANGTVSTWQLFTGDKMLGIPMCVTTNPRGWNDVLSGAQDAWFTAVAKWCVKYNIKKIRMGWEFTDGWAPWGCGGFDTAANRAGFIAVWQHIWTLFNAVAPGFFLFVWNPDCGVASYFAAWEDYYPGDQYVQILAVDVYDKRWNDVAPWSDGDFENLLMVTNPPTLPQIAAFAVQHKLDIALPEWGCYPQTSAPNTNDAPGSDPTFVKFMMDWAISTAPTLTSATKTVYMITWNDGAGSISTYQPSMAQLTTSVKGGAPTVVGVTS